jgi:hypothetical protein
MCLGEWSRMGFVKDNDVRAATSMTLPEVGDEEEMLEDDWDSIMF